MQDERNLPNKEKLPIPSRFQQLSSHPTRRLVAGNRLCPLALVEIFENPTGTFLALKNWG